ncbi:cell envelope integrity protein CreD [Breoghania sp.]|uniref:cell envelope integrity protein CreD n=1 Tax=Breoghania sp. TaxID=2065378 RepID=UPI0026083FF6|nr:cell envelope integrity protein CreD [Breoghania sp.]MDJ0931081.1 cell envelope integrity protein CreD [Breoghania sp.]
MRSARVVASEIATAWGRDQSVVGPIIAVPVLEKIGDTSSRGEAKLLPGIRRKFIYLFPEKLAVKADTAVEECHRSIFTLPVYRSSIDLTGRFAPVEIDIANLAGGDEMVLKPDEAFLFFGIADVRAIKKDVSISVGGDARNFEPGLNGAAFITEGSRSGRSGIHLPLSREDWRNGFEFSSHIALNGSRRIAFAPVGQSTTLAMTSNWPHPSFSGNFLPDRHEIREDGFTADWSIPFLARGVGRAELGAVLSLSPSLETAFVDPLDIYQTVARSLKYSIAFFGLTFMAVFVLELRSGWGLHWMQYLLVGFALVIFFVLLLAFTEQVGFALAYFSVFAATAVLVSSYIATLAHSTKAGAITGAALTIIYGVIYLILNDQDYALLAGSIVAFLVLATVMFATRNIDWSGLTTSTQEARS